jgi:CRISPR/Cas system endoribonuclease Cas6 (RAMP superfamily)
MNGALAMSEDPASFTLLFQQWTLNQLASEKKNAGRKRFYPRLSPFFYSAANKPTKTLVHVGLGVGGSTMDRVFTHRIRGLLVS